MVEEGLQSEENDDPPEAGWYPDPTRAGRERLWDGEAWIDWTRRREEGRTEDSPAGWRPDPMNPAFDRLWSGEQWVDSKRPATGAAESTNRAATSVSPSPPPVPDEGPSTADPATGWLIASYLVALLLPLAGLLVGLLVLRRRGSRHWIPVTFIAGSMQVLSLVVAAASSA